MSARPKRVDDAIDDFDMEFDPSVAATKLPSDITGGIVQLSDFMEIPCSQIVEYRNKKGSDFKPWPEERFQMLVESVRENGVLEPVSVRAIDGDELKFEMLAGEHRWKACIACGRKTVPARVVRNCSDERAADIFTITNLLRRENSIIDKINGWWHFTQAIRYKREDDLKEMVEAGIINQSVLDEAKARIRQVYRYAKMHSLIDELLDMADRKQLSIIAGEQLAYLTHDQQRDLLPYQSALNDKNKATLLHQLAAGELPDKTWCKEEIEAILIPSVGNEVVTLKQATKKVGSVIKDKLPKTTYGQAAEIVSAALDEYLEKHPEYRKKKS